MAAGSWNRRLALYRLQARCCLSPPSLQGQCWDCEDSRGTQKMLPIAGRRSSYLAWHNNLLASLARSCTIKRSRQGEGVVGRARAWPTGGGFSRQGGGAVGRGGGGGSTGRGHDRQWEGAVDRESARLAGRGRGWQGEGAVGRERAFLAGGGRGWQGKGSVGRGTVQSTGRGRSGGARARLAGRLRSGRGGLDQQGGGREGAVAG